MSAQGFSFPPPPPPPPAQTQQQPIHTSHQQWNHRGSGARGRGRGHGNRGRGGFQPQNRGPPSYQAPTPTPPAYSYPQPNYAYPAPVSTSYIPPYSQPNFQHPPAHTSYPPQTFQPAGSAPFPQLQGFTTPYSTPGTSIYPPTNQHAPNPPAMMSPIHWGAEGYTGAPPRMRGRGGHGQRGSGQHQHGKKGNKRDHGAAFKPRASVPRTPAAPAVPSFGNPLPCKPPPAEDVSKPKKRQRKHNQLGLTPNAEEHESSEEEVDDESAAANFSTESGLLQFSHGGRVQTLQSSSDIAAWIAERKKRYPTQARIDEKNEEIEKARVAKELAKVERIAAKKKVTEPALEGEKDESTTNPEVGKAQKRADKKADKMRRDLDHFAKAEAKAEAALLKLEKLRKRLGLDQDQPQNGSSVEAQPTSTSPDITAVVEPVATKPTEPMPELNADSATLAADNEGSISDWTSSSGADSDPSDSDSEASSDEEPEQISSRLQGPEKVVLPPRKKITCRNFASGKCNRGTECKFSHDLPRKAKAKGKAKEEKKGRKGLYAALLDRQKEEYDQRAMEVIMRLGESGLLDKTAPQSQTPA